MLIDISKKQLDIIYTGKKKVLDAIMQKEVNSYWNYRKKNNPALIRSTIFCVEKVAINRNASVLLSETDYAYYLYCTNIIPKDRMINMFCFAAALIETSDKKYVIGRMAKKTSTPFRYQLPGGAIEKKDIYKGKVNLAKNLQHELEEELNIDVINLPIKNPKYIILGNCTMPIIYKMTTTLQSEFIASRYNKIEESGREFMELLFLEKQGKIIDSFIYEKRFSIADYLPDILDADINASY